jgi:membrane protein
MKMRELAGIFRESFDEWNKDSASQFGAALAYYSVFSLAPLLLIAIAIAALLYDEQSARAGIFSEIRTMLGESAGSAVEELMRTSQENAHSGLAALIGIVLLLFGASGHFAQLQEALNAIWKVQPKPDRTWWDMLRDRFLSFGLVLLTGLLLLASLIASTALTAVSHWFSEEALPGGVSLWQAVNLLMSFALITVLFALVFKILPDVRLAWRDVWLGAALTALLFSIGKYLIGLYLGHSSVASIFGAAGSLVVLLLWA